MLHFYMTGTIINIVAVFLGGALLGEWGRIEDRLQTLGRQPPGNQEDPHRQFPARVDGRALDRVDFGFVSGIEVFGSAVYDG